MIYMRIIHTVRRRNRHTGLKFFIFIFIPVMILIYILNRHLWSKTEPVIELRAIDKSKEIATNTIYEAVNLELEQGNLDYENLLIIERDSENNITCLRANITDINKVKSNIALSIEKSFSDLEKQDIKIPLGYIVNGTWVAGRGPDITFRFLAIRNVLVDVRNEFTAAGINQTRHSIVLEIKVNVGIIINKKQVGYTVKTDVPVSETIIIGKVPDTYLNFTPMTAYENDGDTEK